MWLKIVVPAQGFSPFPKCPFSEWPFGLCFPESSIVKISQSYFATIQKCGVIREKPEKTNAPMLTRGYWKGETPFIAILDDEFCAHGI